MRAFDFAPQALGPVSVATVRLVAANRTLCELANRPLSEVLGRTLDELEIWPGGEVDHMLRSKVGESGSVRNHKLRRRSGDAIRYYEISADMQVLGGGPVLVFSVTDVTSRQDLEEEFGESEFKHHRMFHSLHDVYFETDADGIFTLISPSVNDHLDFVPDELIGTRATDISADESELALMLELVSESGVAADFEASVSTAAGTPLPASLNVTAFRDSTGEITSFRGTIRDAQERQAARLELQDLTVGLYQANDDALSLAFEAEQAARGS